MPNQAAAPEKWSPAFWDALAAQPQPARDGYIAECERQAAFGNVPFWQVYDREAHQNLLDTYRAISGAIPFPLP